MADRLKKAVTDVRDRIIALQAVGNDPIFKTVTLFNNQIEREQTEGSYVIAKPAVFIEPTFADPTRLLMGMHQSDITWRFHIVHEELDNEEGSLDANFNVIGFRDKLIATLTKFTPSYCGSIFYVNEEQDFDHNNIYHYIIEMKCGFIDTKGSPYDPDSTDWITAEIDTIKIIAQPFAPLPRIVVVNDNGTAKTTCVDDYDYTTDGPWVWQIPKKKMLAVIVAIPEANGNLSIGTTGLLSDDILPSSPIESGVPMVITIYRYFQTADQLFITSDTTVHYKIYYF